MPQCTPTQQNNKKKKMEKMRSIETILRMEGGRE
jgi:hypothetical protein